MKRIRKVREDKGSLDDMHAEYRFDYRNARPNRFADRMMQSRIVVGGRDSGHVLGDTDPVSRSLSDLILARPTPSKRGNRTK